MTVIFLPFQYTYLQYRGIRGIDTLFEDVIWMYFAGHVIIYVLNSAKKDVEFKSFWTRFGLLGFQLSYFLLIFAYFFCRLYMGPPNSLLQIEEDILSIIVIMMIFSVIILFLSVINDLLSSKIKNMIFEMLKNIKEIYFYFFTPIFSLYIILIYFWRIEGKGILHYLCMTYVSFVYINVVLIQYYRYKKQVGPPSLLRISKLVIYSFGLVIIIFLIGRLILSFT